jgi:HAD superfamily hydrolase (TIGR01509 family)
MPIQLPTPFKALIFDCDGTLVDTAPAHFAAIRQAVAQQGHSMEEAWYMQRTGLTPDDLLDAFEAELQAGSASAHLDRGSIFGRYTEFYQAGLPLLREVAEVAAIAREWHGKVPLAVASNGRLTNVKASLGAVGLLPLFDQIVAAEDVARGKPEPDVYLEAARRIGVAPTACVVLEDTDEGLHAAHAAGMRAVDVRPTSAVSEAG